MPPANPSCHTVADAGTQAAANGRLPPSVSLRAEGARPLWSGQGLLGFSAPPPTPRGCGAGWVTTTKALWVQEAHLRPSEIPSVTPPHQKGQRSLEATSRPPPTHTPTPGPTRAHTHTHTCAHTLSWGLVFTRPKSAWQCCRTAVCGGDQGRTGLSDSPGLATRASPGRGSEPHSPGGLCCPLQQEQAGRRAAVGWGLPGEAGEAGGDNGRGPGDAELRDKLEARPLSWGRGDSGPATSWLLSSPGRKPCKVPDVSMSCDTCFATLRKSRVGAPRRPAVGWSL